MTCSDYVAIWLGSKYWRSNINFIVMVVIKQ